MDSNHSLITCVQGRPDYAKHPRSSHRTGIQEQPDRATDTGHLFSVGSHFVDAGDAGKDRVVSGFAPRELDKRGLALVEQDDIQTAIAEVEQIHRYAVVW